MTTMEDRYFSSGTRLAVFYKLSQTTGRIYAKNDLKPYYGLVLYGPKGLAVNITEPRKITHIGQDRPLQIDWLPATEAMDAELTASATELNIESLVMGVKSETIGTAQLLPLQTSQMGFEPVVGAWFARQTENISGLRRWESYVFSAAKIIFMPSAMTDATADLRYKIAPSIAISKLWGDSWNSSANGATTAQMGQLATTGYPYLCAWQSTTSDLAFAFDTDKLADNATAAILGVWSNGSLVASTDYTKATTGITFHTSPGLDTDSTDSDVPGKIITCLYEGPLLVRV
jgi:hypothetical protein